MDPSVSTLRVGLYRQHPPSLTERRLSRRRTSVILEAGAREPTS